MFGVRPNQQSHHFYTNPKFIFGIALAISLIFAIGFILSLAATGTGGGLWGAASGSTSEIGKYLFGAGFFASLITGAVAAGAGITASFIVSAAGDL